MSLTLAPYAAKESLSQGRRYPEPDPGHRSEYQRDRDRIIHSSAFRRLEYKTQVFINHEGDLFRTRLTHSLEVAQIARTIARTLGLHEDLTEAISLAHDLGHTPFGHAGQDALNECMNNLGGFEHNLQSLRVVDKLEDKYAEFTGLNLCFETREGILKHCTRIRAKTLGDVGERFLNKTQPSLEAQLANLADEIAYNNHDVDDGLRAGLLTMEQMCEVEIFRRHYETVMSKYPELTANRVRHEVIRRMINDLVSDLINQSQNALQSENPASIEEVRSSNSPLIGFSPVMRKSNTELKRLLHKKLYEHHRVYRMTNKAQQVIRELFDALYNDPLLLPPDYQQLRDKAIEKKGDKGAARIVADYIAGMTDRYALDEYDRLFNPRKLIG